MDKVQMQEWESPWEHPPHSGTHFHGMFSALLHVNYEQTQRLIVWSSEYKVCCVLCDNNWDGVVRISPFVHQFILLLIKEEARPLMLFF